VALIGGRTDIAYGKSARWRMSPWLISAEPGEVLSVMVELFKRQLTEVSRH